MKKKYEESNIQAIAEAIREKTGTENTYDTSEMASGVGEVFEVGKKAGIDETKLATWNAITAYGARVYYARAFYEGDYTDFVFPKPIKVTGSAGRMFYNYRGTKLPRKEDIDLSGADVSYTSTDDLYSVHNIFGWASKVTFVPDYGIPAAARYYLNYNNCSRLVEIEKIRSKETTTWYLPFQGCKALTTLTIEGVIGTDFEIKDSPLSPASFKNIIKHLKDYKGTDKDDVYTLTFNGFAWDVFANSGFDDDDYAWIESKYNVPKDEFISLGVGWQDIVLGLGWNLVFA